MPRAASGESIASWFREYYRANPRAIKIKSNEAVLASWEAAHPGQEVTKQIKQSMANVKSDMKKKRRRRRKAVAQEGGAVAVTSPRTSRVNTASLERLELAIDRCLDMARGLENPKLEKVIKNLRFARNDVVLISGEE
jgi:hypothetical protein